MASEASCGSPARGFAADREIIKLRPKKGDISAEQKLRPEGDTLPPKVIKRRHALAKGLFLYYTGKLCKHGHRDERYTSNSHCLTCSRIYNRGRPRDQSAAKMTRWRLKHIDHYREYQREYQRRWHALHPFKREIYKENRKMKKVEADADAI